MKLVVCSHNLKSTALKNLATELTNQLGYKVWRVNAAKPNQLPVTFLPGIDKVRQFTCFAAKGVSSPRFATDAALAQGWDSKNIVVRHLIDASEGKGIEVVARGSPLPQAPLYTEYIPKKKEFRVHVWDNKVIDTQEKRCRRGAEEKEYQVRNTANGYVFCRDNVVPPPDCHDVALAAVASLGRTYGAVDVVWNEKRNVSYVLEVNSRPGMEGTTVKKYADAIVSGLPDDVRHPPVRVVRPVARRARVLPVRADGKKLITTKKGNRVWR